MRIAVLADVHGNHDALARVLADVDDWRPDAVVVAGDIVGYGAEPNACIRALRARGAACVAGNHEAMVLGASSFDRCTHAGIRAALWTRDVLGDDERAWLAALPPTRAVAGDVLVCHGSPRDACAYVTTLVAAGRALADGAPARVVVCGHTHQPCALVDGRLLRPDVDGVEARFARQGRLLLNPGSVGHARDGRASARYARLDVAQGVVEFRALPYDRAVPEDKMRRAGLVAETVLPPARHPFDRRVEAWRTRAARRLARSAWGRAALRVGLRAPPST